MTHHSMIIDSQFLLTEVPKFVKVLELNPENIRACEILKKIESDEENEQKNTE